MLLVAINIGTSCPHSCGEDSQLSEIDLELAITSGGIITKLILKIGWYFMFNQISGYGQNSTKHNYLLILTTLSVVNHSQPPRLLRASRDRTLGTGYVNCIPEFISRTTFQKFESIDACSWPFSLGWAASSRKLLGLGGSICYYGLPMLSSCHKTSA